MGFQESLRHTLRHTFDYRGRAGRKEFTLYSIGLLILSGCDLAASYAWGAAGAGPHQAAARTSSLLLLILLLTPTSFSLFVRRLHDVGLWGWCALLVAVPHVSGPMWLAGMVIPGRGSNRWGTRL